MSLTSVFGMGTGVPSPQSTPTIYLSSGFCPRTFIIIPPLDSLVKRFFGDPSGIRTHVNGVRGRCLIETVNIIFLTNDEVVQFVPEDISYGKISIKFDVWDIERLYQSIFSGTAVERQLIIKLKKKYAAPLHLIKVNGSNDIYDCYIGVISGELLATFC